MRTLFERTLSKMFPPDTRFIVTLEDRQVWSRYEVQNHPETDPFRPFGHHDSWAGNIKVQNEFLEFRSRT